MQPNLESLIERIEKATGPDRELDVLIERECGANGSRIAELIAGSPHNTIDEIAKAADREIAGLFFRIPAYTASLDAAMTLVPEGWPVRDLSQWSDSWTVQLDWPNRKYCSVDAEAATPALALCAASLRARSHINTEGETR